MISTLLPKKLVKTDPSYSTVEELGDVLEHAMKEKDIRNIAVTGPFGSGKSSVLKTLMSEDSHYHYLPISLATLRANDEKEGEPKPEELENLNRKIEYSIVQQLIYRESDETLPNSRLKRIKHLPPKRLGWLSTLSIFFILSLFVLFEPSISRIKPFYQWLDSSRLNVVFYLFAACCVLYCLFFIFQRVIQVYSGSKLNRLNLKDAEIQVVENNSIFNKHLDEILYFFQATKYDVVILEDLDRFNTKDIFLKLRELNQLINESKIVGRHIVFIYAVKDDLFVNEDRTKFFDYVTTVIPVINSSNSKEKLKEELNMRGLCDGIKDDDLSEIAFFIQDMRLLTNIVNEFEQYKKMLSLTNSASLNTTKLLAMIVYKNYHPDDFAKLHHRDGKVYDCLSLKNSFVDLALTEISAKEEQYAKEKKLREDNLHLKEADLRLLFLQRLRERTNIHIAGFYLNNTKYDLITISKDPSLFNDLIAQNTVKTYISDSYGPRVVSSNILSAIKETENEMNFSARISALQKSLSEIEQEDFCLAQERQRISSLKFQELVRNYHFFENASYKKLDLPPLLDVFIQLGYIDEDYFDYISYFYEGTITQSDRDLLLSIKRGISKPYTYHIEKIEGFIKELKPYMFDSNAILNNDLLDYVAEPKRLRNATKETFRLVLRQLNTPSHNLEFLSQYYKKGQQSQVVFTELITRSYDSLWNSIAACPNSKDAETLFEAFLKYCGELRPEQLGWIKENYSFLAKHQIGLGNERIQSFVSISKFISLTDDDAGLLDMVLDKSAFEINQHNLCLLLNHLVPSTSITEDRLYLSELIGLGNPSFTNYIKQNLDLVLPLLSSKDKIESSQNLLLVINSDIISDDEKKVYLSGQTNKIESLSEVENRFQEIALSTFIVPPTWQNVNVYYSRNGVIDSSLASFINDAAEQLEKAVYPRNDDNTYTKFQAELLLTSVLKIHSYQKVSRAFKAPFNNETELGSLDPERLRILISNGLICFSAETSDILSSTEVYLDYLTKDPQAFISSLDEYNYSFNSDDAQQLLSKTVFSKEDKGRIIERLDKTIVLESSQLTDQVISIITQTKNEKHWTGSWIELISHSKDNVKCVELLTLLIKKDALSEQEIIDILTALDAPYSVIAERKKKPVIEDNFYNQALLAELKHTHFISSFSNVKNGIRVHPRRI